MFQRFRRSRVKLPMTPHRKIVIKSCKSPIIRPTCLVTESTALVAELIPLLLQNPLLRRDLATVDSDFFLF